MLAINCELGSTIPMVEQNGKVSLPIARYAVVFTTDRKICDGEPGPRSDPQKLMALFWRGVRAGPLHLA